MVQSPPNFAYLDRLPPQSIDAEEALLGCLLLDPGAIHRVVATLRPDAFFIDSHKEIYKAALAVHTSGQIVDLMSVTTWLHSHKWLERIGGQGKLVELLSQSVTSVNADRYAALIMDKYYRRRVIEAGHEIAQLGHEDWASPEALSSQIEQKLLGKKGLLHHFKSEKQRSRNRYAQMIEAVKEAELTIENPGLKRWELQQIASSFGCSLKSLEECWYHHLLFSGEVKRETWADIEALAGEHREWLLHGLLPKEGLVLLHAEGGVGKTRLFYDWAFCLIFGISWNELFSITKQGRKILLVQTDELASEMYEALKIRGFFDNPNIEFIRNWDINNLAALNKHIDEFDPDVTFIDSLNSVSNNCLISENDVEYARPVLALRKLSEEKNKLIFLNHHSNRQGEARGSTAIKASCSMEMKLSRDPRFSEPDSGRRILTLGKTRSYRRPAAYSIDFNAETGQWTWLGEHLKEEALNADLPLKQRIVDFLSAHPNQRFEYEELHHEVGGAIDSVRRAACELAGDGLILRVKKGKRSVFFLAWEAETNHRHDQQKNVIMNDHVDDHKRNTQPASTPEVHDHVITKNAISEPPPEEQISRSHDHKPDHEACKQEPASNTVHDQVHDQVMITTEIHDRKRDHDRENAENSNSSLQSQTECDREITLANAIIRLEGVSTYAEYEELYSLYDEELIIDEAWRALPSEYKEKIEALAIQETVQVEDSELPDPLLGATVRYSGGCKELQLFAHIDMEVTGVKERSNTAEYDLLNCLTPSGETKTFLRRALRIVEKTDSGSAPVVTGRNPYHIRTNPPKKGDRIKSSSGKAGQIIKVRASNPKYIIRWEDEREMHYDFEDLQTLDIRRES